MTNRRRKKRSLLINVPVASMGDIAFLLIIFFVLCSRFAQKSVQIEPPTSADAVDLKEGQITVQLDAQGHLYFQGREVDNAAAIEAGVREMTTGKTSEVARTVMFKCDRSIPKRQFEPVIEAIVKAGGLLAALGDQVDLPPPTTEPEAQPETEPEAQPEAQPETEPALNRSTGDKP